MTAKQFHAWRLRCGFTWHAAAEALGMSERHVMRYAAGTPIPVTVALACEAIEFKGERK